MGMRTTSRTKEEKRLGGVRVDTAAGGQGGIQPGGQGRTRGQHGAIRQPAPPLIRVPMGFHIAGGSQTPTPPRTELGLACEPPGINWGQRRHLHTEGGLRCGRGLRHRGNTPPLPTGKRPSCPRRVRARPDPLRASEWREAPRVIPEGSVRIHGRGQSNLPTGPRREGGPQRPDFLVAGGGVGRVSDREPSAKGPRRAPTAQSCPSVTALLFGSPCASMPETAYGVPISQFSRNQRKALGGPAQQNRNAMRGG